MIAVDTNLLVYAHRPEMSFHERAREVLTEAVGGTEPVSVPWPCVHEFLATVSNPRIFGDPTPIGVALDAARRLLASLSGERYAYGKLSENYRRVYESSEKTDYGSKRLLCDAVSGMTEPYLIKTYHELKDLHDGPT